MYSFGRLNAYNPFVGGFVHENIKWGTFKRFKKTVTAIYSIEVTEEQYEIIRNIIEKLKEHKDDYKFNIMGLFGVAFHFKLSRNKKFYCAEFVKYLIEAANIELDLPELIKPNDFQYLRNLKLEYKGELYKYHLSFNYL